MYEIKTEDLYEDLYEDFSTGSKYYDNWKNSVVGKIKDETASVGIKYFVGLKLKMYLFLVDDSSWT